MRTRLPGTLALFVLPKGRTRTATEEARRPVLGSAAGWSLGGPSEFRALDDRGAGWASVLHWTDRCLFLRPAETTCSQRGEACPLPSLGEPGSRAAAPWRPEAQWPAGWHLLESGHV